jgi:Uma2 family endonuclease
MSQPVRQPGTVDAFFVWQESQSERYELVGGFPVRLMAGASNAHDRIVVNLLAELRNQLRGGPCRPFTGNGSVETYPGQIRRPDVGVDCGRFDPHGCRAAEPRLVAEVLSPSTRDFDAFAKLTEYQAVATISHVLLVEPNLAEVALWSRADEGAWIASRIEGLDGVVQLPAIGVALQMSDLYEGIEFPETPSRLVSGEPASARRSSG